MTVSRQPPRSMKSRISNPRISSRELKCGAERLHGMAAVRGRCPRFLRLTRHNHISLVAHFNSGEEILGLEILDFIERGG